MYAFALHGSTPPPITSLTDHHTAARPGLSCAHHLPCPSCPRCPPLYPPLSLSRSSPFSAPPFLLCTSPLLSWSSPSCVLCSSLKKPSDLWFLAFLSFLNTAVQMASLTPEAEAPGGGALLAAGDDVAAANLLAAAVATEGPVFDMPDFKMGGKKSDDAAPTDAGDEDGGDDDGDEDGDFGEGEEDVSEDWDFSSTN
uniref:Uncharacterized protein n=1 Tax=Oryza nivara TaxID=4536 RepID=A0A0E0GKM3_ORYNI